MQVHTKKKAELQMVGQGGPEGESRQGSLALVSQGPSHQLVGGAVQPGVDGRGGGPSPVSQEVAGIAVPPQGQDGLSHLF